MFCIACTATNLLLIVLFNCSHDSVTRLRRRIYRPICTAVPLVIALPPLSPVNSNGHHLYGDANQRCWIPNRFVPYRFYLLYIPFRLLFLFKLAVYLLVGWVVWGLAGIVKRCMSTARRPPWW